MGARISPNGQHGPLSINFEKKSRPLLPDKFDCKNPVAFETRKEGECGWIVGEPRALMCCGAPTAGRYYCPDHHIIAWVRPPTREQRL